LGASGIPIQARKSELFVRKSLLSRYSADFGTLVSRRDSERALRAAAIEAALANRAKSEFLANMSHELRTPLNAIIGFSDLIRYRGVDRDSPAKTLEYAEHISNAGQHLLAIISDILDLSKIENRALKLELETLAVQDTVRESLTLVQARIEEKFQTLTLRIADGIAPFPHDRLRIKQVLLNLLTNASRFTPEGGEITVAVASESAHVLIAVIDTGVGMTPEQVERAIKPFGQIKSAYIRNRDGAGLGLPIAKAMVEEHGGKFFILSEPKVGTHVNFSLPRSQRAKSQDPSRTATESTGKGTVQ
jgi:two-component system cell cycle sensor histidine kinase PleC